MEESPEQSEPKDISYDADQEENRPILSSRTGEKKRKLLREKELRAAETQALASKTASERATLGMNDVAMPDTTTQPKRSGKTGHLRVSARSEESSRSAMPDLCPSVTTQPHYQPDHPCPEPPQAPATRKVRTIFPFDLSDPFKFQGMQPDFQAIDEIGNPVQVYSRIMAARNMGNNEEQADQGWNGL